ncbi:IS1380 family transposase [Microbulbifer sp. VVAC002]|uniref:IS1380 family transposase n=1 Tax=Microbulbifer sp. VVAC002 TaxID=3243387 RepID=UPI0040396528
MTECYQPELSFSSIGRRKITADFTGGDLTSNAGLLLLRECDRRLGLARSVADAVHDPRDPARVEYSTEQLVRQRLLAIAAGFEDLNDHDQLRYDSALQTGCQRLKTLASTATLCRFEQQQNRSVAFDLHKVLFDQFVARHKKPPKRLILDFDATDIPVHGEQEQRFFHGYYDSYCFMPLYVFCGRHLLVSYLRHCRQDAAKHSWAILALLVKALRQQWPEVEILFRGDSGFCRHRMLDGCDRNGVKYIVGIARNSRLESAISGYLELAKRWSHNGAFKISLFRSFQYAAGTWKHKRRVIGKAEYAQGGPNPRFITINLEEEDAEKLYREVYCARGDMENRIKDQQMDLFADRTSCHRWWPNQWRLLLSALAWVLFEHLRDQLENTQLARASVATLRNRLIKAAAVVIKNTRRLRFLLPTGMPDREIFCVLASRLVPT